jgi:3-deoxy-D-arabino-heptulosonate 7-phosphate (DAHP) synthase
MLELANMLKILNKGAAMNYFKPLSISLQKEIAQRNICLESEIDRSDQWIVLVLGPCFISAASINRGDIPLLSPYI